MGGAFGDALFEFRIELANFFRRLFPFGDVHRHTQEGRLAGARCDEGKFDCLEEARAPGGVSQWFFRDRLGPAAGDHFPVVPHERFCLSRVDRQVQVGAADHLLRRQAVGLGEGAVGKQVAAFGVLGENEMRHQVDHQAQQMLALAQRLLGAFALGGIHEDSD